MRRWVGWLCLFLWAFFAVAGVAAPQIWIEEPEYQFGIVAEGDSVQHTFVLENRGDETLAIDSIRTGCGCTTARLTTQSLAPGESVPVTITFRTNGYGGQVVSRAITVYSNDPVTPELVLFIKGTVEKDPLCQIEPAEFLAGFYVLIDVREPERYALGHLIGAINLPLEELASWIDYMPPRVTIMLYDEDGSEIYSALEQLVVSGIDGACGLAGGLTKWVEAYGSSLLVSFKLLPGEL